MVYKRYLNLLKQVRKDRFRHIITFLLILLSLLSIAQVQTGPLYFSGNENLAKKTEKFLFIRVETNKKEVLAGEALVAKYSLYVAVDIEGKLSKSPSFTGFASYDMEAGNTDAYSVEKIGNIPFRVYLIKQVQLYGVQPGVQRLQPVELEASIRYRKPPNGEGPHSEELPGNDTLISYTVKSPPVEILVKPLPADEPMNFSGAVGNFEFSAFVSATKIPEGVADTLHLVLKGKGNWHEIRFPEINWPQGTEVFEPYESESLNPGSIPVEGLRTLSFPVVFHQKGKKTIPPVGFTYFDPQTSKFITTKSDSITLLVTGAAMPGMQSQKSNKQKLTNLFTNYAIVIFPAIAIILGSILFLRWRKN